MIEHSLVRATVIPEILRLIANYYNQNEDTALEQFYQSKTAAAYADDDTGLYGQSPLHITGCYIMERDGNLDLERLQAAIAPQE